MDHSAILEIVASLRQDVNALFDRLDSQRGDMAALISALDGVKDRVQLSIVAAQCTPHGFSLLPPELFTLILRYAIDESSGRLGTSPELLCCVCSSWRDVVPTSQTLWTDISIEEGAMPSKVSTRLIRSGKYPLDISVNLLQAGYEARSSFLGLVAYASRWKTLRITLSNPSLFAWITGVISPLPVPWLESVSMTYNGEKDTGGAVFHKRTPSGRSMFAWAPKLQRLHLLRVCVKFMGPLSTFPLTHLAIALGDYFGDTGLLFQHFVESLPRLCDTLESLKYTLRAVHGDFPGFPHPMVQMRALTIITLLGDVKYRGKNPPKTESVKQLFDIMSAPNLQVLEIHGVGLFGSPTHENEDSDPEVLPPAPFSALIDQRFPSLRCIRLLRCHILIDEEFIRATPLMLRVDVDNWTLPRILKKTGPDAWASLKHLNLCVERCYKPDCGSLSHDMTDLRRLLVARKAAGLPTPMLDVSPCFTANDTASNSCLKRDIKWLRSTVPSRWLKVREMVAEK